MLMKNYDIIKHKTFGKLYKIIDKHGHYFWYSIDTSKSYTKSNDRYLPTNKISNKLARELYEQTYTDYFACEKLLNKIDKTEGKYNPTIEEIKLLNNCGFIEDTGLTYYIKIKDTEYGYRTAEFDIALKKYIIKDNDTK